jgi:hypothetical protein
MIAGSFGAYVAISARDHGLASPSFMIRSDISVASGHDHDVEQGGG